MSNESDPVLTPWSFSSSQTGAREELVQRGKVPWDFVGLGIGHLPSASCLTVEGKDKSSQGGRQGDKSQTSSRRQGTLLSDLGVGHGGRCVIENDLKASWLE